MCKAFKPLLLESIFPNIMYWVANQLLKWLIYFGLSLAVEAVVCSTVATFKSSTSSSCWTSWSTIVLYDASKVNTMLQLICCCLVRGQNPLLVPSILPRQWTSCWSEYAYINKTTNTTRNKILLIKVGCSKSTNFNKQKQVSSTKSKDKKRKIDLKVKMKTKTKMNRLLHSRLSKYQLPILDSGIKNLMHTNVYTLSPQVYGSLSNKMVA